MQPSDAEIVTRLRAILQSDEFQPRLAERIWIWRERALDALLKWLARLSPGMRGLVMIACVVILAAIALHLWRSYREAAAPDRRPAVSGGARQEAGVTPELLLARARALADGGSIRDAARALQQALLLATCLRRNTPWRPSLSDWEWVGILRPPSEVIAFTRTTERLAFGPEPTREAFDACAREVQALLARGAEAGTRAA